MEAKNLKNVCPRNNIGFQDLKVLKIAFFNKTHLPLPFYIKSMSCTINILNSMNSKTGVINIKL